MATENFLIDKPGAGAQSVVTIPEGELASFTFGTSDIQGMRLSNSGELLVTFTDGSSLIIDNFSSLAGEGMKITMSDGTVVDFQSLFQSLASARQNVANTPEITPPENGETKEVVFEEGREYNLAFDPAAVTEIMEDSGALYLVFGNNGMLVLSNFASAADFDTPPTMNFNGQFLAVQEFADTLRLADVIYDGMEDEESPQTARNTTRTSDADEQEMAALGEQLAEVEPAAGDQGGGAGSRGGFGFQSNVDDAPLGSPDDVGPIGPTELQFGLPEGEEPLTFVEDEDPAAAAPPEPILVTNDDLVFEDNKVTLDISAYSNAGPSVTTTVTVAGIPADWQVTPNQGTYDAASGTWTITLQPGDTFSGGPTLNPPFDSDVDLSGLVITATNTDTSTGLTTSVNQSVDVITDAVADRPELEATGATGDEDNALPLDINATVGDIDGSEEITAIYLRGVPDGFTLSSGTYNGAGEWQLTQADLSGLTISAPQNYSGSLALALEVVAEEVNTSDTEPYLHNNTAKSFGEITVAWNPVADAPELTVSDAQVKEDGSVFVPVEAKLVDTDGSEFLTLTLTGLPDGWDLIGTDWDATGVPGEYSLSVMLGSDYDGGFLLFPPADSDVDLSGLQITATSTEIENGDEAGTTQSFDVIVDAVADAPQITADSNTGNEDTALDVDISGLLTDTDGSEAIIKYQVSGVPSGFSFNQGTDLGTGAWEFTPVELAGLTMSAPADYFGSVNLSATVFTSEDPATDGEFDGADNDAQASAEFTMTWKPVIEPPSVEANNGADDAIVKEDGSVFVPVAASLNPADSADAFLTVTVTGIDPAWNVSFTEGAYDANAGTWSVTLPAGANYDGGLTFAPPADSDADMSGLVATATATEPASGISASAADGFNVVTDAVADTPTVSADDVSGNEDSAVALDIGAQVTDTDGSESITKYRISGVPDGYSLSAGDDLGGGVWEVAAGDASGLTISAPSDYYGSLDLTVTAYAEETALSGDETDYTDNVATASTEFTVEWKPVIEPPSVEANNGVDDAIVKEDGSIFVPVTASLNPADSADAFLTVTVTGIDPSWGVSFTEGAYDANAGTWSVTLPAGANYDGGLTFSPPSDADLDMSGLVATATATEPASGMSASAADEFNVVTDAVADTPDLLAEAADGEEGTTIDLDINVNVTDMDGSESITHLTISGFPDGMSLTAGTETAPRTWTLLPSELTNLGIVVADGVTGTYDFTVTAYAEETALSGAETDYTDNVATAVDTLHLAVVADDEPIITNALALVDESDLSSGIIECSSVINVDFGSDTPGTFEATGSFSSSGSQLNNNLTSGGAPVVVNLAGSIYTGTAGGETVFTLTIDPDTGSYDFNLIGTLDHADGNDPDDVISLVFGFDATDSDGDSDSGHVRVDVYDDAPEIQDIDHLVVAGGEGSYEGQVTVTGLADGAKSYTLSALNGEVPDGLTYETYSYGDVLPADALAAGLTAPEEGGSLVLAYLDGAEEPLYFALSIDITGHYEFTLINSNPLVREDVDLSTVPPGNYPDGLYYDTDAQVWTDTDPGNAELYISGSASVNPSAEGIGIGNNQFEINETVSFAFNTNIATASVSTVRQSGSSDWELEVAWFAYDGGENGELVDQGTVVFSGANATYDFSTDLDIQFDTLVLTGLDSSQSSITHDNAKYTISSFEYSEAVSPDDMDLAFDVGVTDNDGDSDSAPLYIEMAGDDMIVGRNIDDNDDSATGYIVGDDEGVIEGSVMSDVLVGDAGGSQVIEQTQDYNVVLALDVSGSMGSRWNPDSKISILIDSVKNLLTDFNNYQSGEIKVHIVPFSSKSETQGTFTATDSDDFLAAINFVEGLNGNGFTNYESALQTAIDWLEGPDVLDNGAETYTYFITDGQPNYYMADDETTVVSNGSADYAMKQITGVSDGTNEVAQLQSLSDAVIGVGVDIGGAISRVDVIDSDGNALNIDDPADLNAVLTELSPLNRLSTAGDDVIKGGDGDDLIFGDVLNTDQLAELHGFTTSKGAGWEVFEKLEAGESALNPAWSRQDTVDYIKNNAEELSASTIDAQGETRSGGHDRLGGGAGDDVIFGQEGDDVIAGGMGNDTLYGGDGDDVFLFESIADGVDTIADFDMLEGDSIDMSALLTAYNPLQHSLDDFIFAREESGNTVLSVDVSGSGNAANAVDVVVVESVTGLDLASLVTTDSMHSV